MFLNTFSMITSRTFYGTFLYKLFLRLYCHGYGMKRSRACRLATESEWNVLMQVSGSVKWELSVVCFMENIEITGHQKKNTPSWSTAKCKLSECSSVPLITAEYCPLDGTAESHNVCVVYQGSYGFWVTQSQPFSTTFTQPKCSFLRPTRYNHY